MVVCPSRLKQPYSHSCTSSFSRKNPICYHYSVTTELRKHLPPLVIVFLLISFIWFIRGVSWSNYPLLFIGLAIGSFLLDVDHLVHWLFINPNTDESRLAKIAIFRYDYKSVIKLLESTHKKHTSLVFHHFFFQVVLATISIFIVTSSASAFAMGLVIALNIHLLVDEYDDLYTNPTHLQNWLFARESKQLPTKYLPHYTASFVALNLLLVFLVMLHRS